MARSARSPTTSDSGMLASSNRLFRTGSSSEVSLSLWCLSGLEGGPLSVALRAAVGVSAGGRGAVAVGRILASRRACRALALRSSSCVRASCFSRWVTRPLVSWSSFSSADCDITAGSTTFGGGAGAVVSLDAGPALVPRFALGAPGTR